MTHRVVSLVLLLFVTDLASAGNRPGSGGGCDGLAPKPLPPNRGAPSDIGGTRRFLTEVAFPAKLRSLQGNDPGAARPPFILGQEEIDLCCTGNGDFEFLMRDLDIGGLAVATEAEGFLSIPGGGYSSLLLWLQDSTMKCLSAVVYQRRLTTC